MSEQQRAEELAETLRHFSPLIRERGHGMAADRMHEAADRLERLEALERRLPLPVVCICGSTRFADEHAIARWELEKDGRHVCLMVNYLPQWYWHEQGWDAGHHFAEQAGCKERLDELHKRKIDMADWVLVIAPGDYIGESTRAEIEYAEQQGKPVRYVELGSEAAERAAHQHQSGEGGG